MAKVLARVLQPGAVRLEGYVEIEQADFEAWSDAGWVEAAPDGAAPGPEPEHRPPEPEPDALPPAPEPAAPPPAPDPEDGDLL